MRIPKPAALTLIVSPGTAGFAAVMAEFGVTSQQVELVYAVRVTVELVLEEVEIGMPVPAAPPWFAVITTRLNWPPTLAVTCGSPGLLIALTSPCTMLVRLSVLWTV